VKSRNPVFDVMKGMGIILMLIGHIPPGDTVYHFIYSFHMPLFFVVAGVFAKTTQGGEREFFVALKKDAKRLVLPVVITHLLILALSPLHYMVDRDFHYVMNQFLSLLWNGDTIHTQWGNLSSDMWFLLALFWTRTIFRGLDLACVKLSKWHDEVVVAICALLSVLAVVLHVKFAIKLPWEILRGMTAVIFYASGWYLNRHKQPVWFYLLTVVVWLLALKFGGVDMHPYYYKCYPLDVVGSIGAIWLVYEFSKGLCFYTPGCSKVLRWFGINSLVIFCIHCLDRNTYLVKTVRYVLGIHVAGIYSVLIHYAITLLIVIIILYIPFMKRIYEAKRWREI